MHNLLLGLLAIAVGSLFCFRGYRTMRLVITLWGAFCGFLLGAGLVDRLTGTTFLVGAQSWLVGLVLAVIFGLLAYTFYEVSVVLAMAAAGFVLGADVMIALHIRWSWAVILVGVLVGVALAVIAVAGRLPMLLLAALTALAGAGTIVAGVMLLTGSLTAQDLGSAAVVSRIDDSAGWWVLYGGLTLAGILLQLRVSERLSPGMRHSVRGQWAPDGGRQLHRR